MYLIELKPHEILSWALDDDVFTFIGFSHGCSGIAFPRTSTFLLRVFSTFLGFIKSLNLFFSSGKKSTGWILDIGCVCEWVRE